jgi:hypothetical protein
MDSLNTGNLNISNLKNHPPHRRDPGSTQLLELLSPRQISHVRDQ